MFDQMQVLTQAEARRNKFNGAWHQSGKKKPVSLEIKLQTIEEFQR